jgi:hypothetical protein
MKKKNLILASCAILLPVLFASSARAQVKSYLITIENLTTSGAGNGQPFSPYVFASHNGTEAFWNVGSAASFGIQRIAEEGDNSALVSDLNLAKTLGSTVGTIATGSGPLFPGTSSTFSFVTDAAHPFLSSAWMLGWTNDGFTGIQQFDLSTVPAIGTITFNLLALDAGTEINNEKAAYLAPLGGILNEPENGVVSLHPGIVGGNDIPLSRGWSNPVARISISAAPEPGVLALLTLAPPALALRRRRRI